MGLRPRDRPGVSILSALADLLGHNSWATSRLIDHCASLTAEQRALTTAGSYGTISEILRHIVGAESWYLLLITKERPSQELDRKRTYEPAQLAPIAAENTSRWAAFAATEPDRIESITVPEGAIPLGALLAQLVHHGNEHRGQIRSILGAHGLAVPDLSAWKYAGLEE